MEALNKTFLISVLMSGSFMANAADDLLRDFLEPESASVTHYPEQRSNEFKFNALCKDVMKYQVYSFKPLSGNLEVKKFYARNLKIDGREEEISKELIALSENDLSKFLQKVDRGDNWKLSVLERLFDINLGAIAEKICDHFKEELPLEIKALLAIYHGESVELTEIFSQSYLGGLAYRVANQAGNYAMVEKIYALGIEQFIEQRKKDCPELFSPELNYIHPPYWSFNIVQLKQYGKKVIEKISPYFIIKEQLIEDKDRRYVMDKEEKVLVRKDAVEFGRVLPLLYLQLRFENENVQTLRVPRIFIFPKHETSNVTFNFKMSLSGDSGNNPLQVWCDDFDIYQEYIQGEGLYGSRSFTDYGHRDLNAKQVVRSASGTRYLIDTKEQKNFFVPYLSPFSDDYLYDEQLKSIIKAFGEKEMPDERDMMKIFSKWQNVQKDEVWHLKSLNFDSRAEYVTVQVSYRD